MVKDKRAVIVAALLIAVAAWLLFFRDPGTPEAGSANPTPAARGAKDRMPWINLERLKSEHPEIALGRRDVFRYGATAPPPTPIPPPTPEGGEQEQFTPTEPPPPPPPTPVPITLKFMGVLGEKKGPRIAVLLTDQKEILHGREGEVLAGRYRIAKIGLESIEIEDVTSGTKSNIRIGGR